MSFIPIKVGELFDRLGAPTHIAGSNNLKSSNLHIVKTQYSLHFVRLVPNFFFCYKMELYWKHNTIGIRMESKEVTQK